MKPSIVKVNHLNRDEMLEYREQRRFNNHRDKGHYFFDKIWKDANLLSRGDAYKWLAKKLNVRTEYAHFKYLNDAQCSEAIQYSQQLLNDNRRMDIDFGCKPVTPFYIL